jgi:hypothetical protein
MEKGSINNIKDQGTAEIIATVDKQVKPLAAFMSKFNNDWSLVMVDEEPSSGIKQNLGLDKII